MNSSALTRTLNFMQTTPPEFTAFPKIARLNREIIITEKIDGTNAQVHITDSGDVFAGSRNRWITPQADNYGFARWVEGNKSELLKLGPGSHFGEWWGPGIQRGYGIKEKKFSLFNVLKWGKAEDRPACCDVVPKLWEGLFNNYDVLEALRNLEKSGSVASPGFMRPEGIIVRHTANGVLFKVLLENDHLPKGQAN
jgi:hypothetical protein